MQLVVPYKPDHPVLPFTRQRLQALIETDGVEGANKLILARNRAIRSEEADPFRFGYELIAWRLADVLWGWVGWTEFVADDRIPEAWKCDAVRALAGQIKVLLILGGNRAAKTEYMIKRLVQSAMARERAEIWCLHSTNKMSINYHQRLAWKYFPRELRDMGKSRNPQDPTYISYSQQNGFSGSAFTLPNAAMCEFRNYEQDLDTFEGGRLGCPSREPCIGYVADELVPLELVDTLEYRLSDFNGVGIIGFTPKRGYTPTVASFLDSATQVLSVPYPDIESADGAGPAIVPVLESTKDPRRAIVYFQSRYNPYGNYQELLEIASRRSRAERLMRLCGVPSRRVKVLFPRFLESVHVKKMTELPAEGTRYFYLDPAGAKNWCMGWVLVDVFGRLHVYREWPCPRIAIAGHGLPEPWAEPGQSKGHEVGGIPGGGQDGLGLTLLDYKEEIARMEGWDDRRKDVAHVAKWDERNGAMERIRLRYMDSRFADAPSFTVAENTTLMEECAKVRLFFEMASGKNQEEGWELINDALGFKENWQTPEDGPKLFVYEDCENFIFALKAFTGTGGGKEATKDFIDLLRYMFMSQPVYIPEARSTGNVPRKRLPVRGRDAEGSLASKIKRRRGMLGKDADGRRGA